jgi:hypothetical protein
MIFLDCKDRQLPDIHLLREIAVEEGGFDIHMMHLPSLMVSHSQDQPD